MVNGSRAALRDLSNHEPWIHGINRSYDLVYDGNELVGATFDVLQFLNTYPNYHGGEVWFEQVSYLESNEGLEIDSI